MPKEESGYLITGKLGQSTAKVYFGVDSKTKTLAVVKMQSRLAAFWRELIVTDYLLEIGEIVPKILKATIKKDGTTVIVREYFKGLTGEELHKERMAKNLDLPAELSESAWKILDIERDRLKILYYKGDHEHLSFKDWYLANSPRLLEKYQDVWATIQKLTHDDLEMREEVEDVLLMPDFHRGNFLFDVDRHQWIAFDP